MKESQMKVHENLRHTEIFFCKIGMSSYVRFMFLSSFRPKKRDGTLAPPPLRPNLVNYFEWTEKCFRNYESFSKLCKGNIQSSRIRVNWQLQNNVTLNYPCSFELRVSALRIIRSIYFGGVVLDLKKKPSTLLHLFSSYISTARYKYHSVTHVLHSLSVSVKSMGTLISTLYVLWRALFGALVCTVCTGCTVEYNSVYVHKNWFHFALL